MDTTLSTNLLKAVSKLSWETSLEHSRDYEKLLRFAKKSLVNQGIISCEDLYMYGAERWVNTGLPAKFFERLQAYCHCPPPPSGTPPGSESLPGRAPSLVLQAPSAAEPSQPVLRTDAAEFKPMSAAVKTGIIASAPDVTSLAKTAAPRQGLNANASKRVDSPSRGLRGEVVEVLQGGTPDASRSDIISEEIETEAEVRLQKEEDEYDAVLRPSQHKVDKKHQEQFEFVGTWLATKSGDILDIPLHGFQITGERTCEYTLGRELFKGTVEVDGMIHWSDGDIWKKVGVAEQTAEERSVMRRAWERKAAKAWRLDEEAAAEEAEKRAEAEAAARRVAVEEAAARRSTEKLPKRRLLPEELPKQPRNYQRTTEETAATTAARRQEHQERRYEIQELLEHRRALGNQPILNDLPEAINLFESFGACLRDLDGCADYASDLWVELCSIDNTDDVYYWHPRSGKKQNSPPCFDPEGIVEQPPVIWVRCTDPESGYDYFWKKDTDETLWELPRLVSEEDMSLSVPSRQRLEETESQEPAPEFKALDPAQVLLARAEAAEAEMMSLKSQNAILSEELQKVRQKSQSEREQIVSEERQEARRLLFLDKDRILWDRDRILFEERQQVEKFSFEYGAELEVWRHLEGNTVSLHDRPHLHTAAHAMLTDMVPTSHHRPCSRMQNVRILSVQQVTNTAMWRRYIFNRDQLLNQLRNRPRVQKIESICAKATSIKDHLPYKLQLYDLANEVLLLHGTSIETALRICNQGFDDRMARRQLYGRGVYFTVDSCKAAQYCDHHVGSIIVARVVLGDPFIATGPMPTADRPPDVRDTGVPHDSIIVRPGISNSKNKGKGKGQSKQTHWEFVVPRGDLQVYPEFLITFEYT